MFVPTLLGLMLWGAAAAQPTGQDVGRVTERVASALDGVISPCPSTWQAAGSGQKRCVRADDGPDAVRRALTRSSTVDLYGAWRSQSNPNYLYNWARTPNGFVSILVAPSAPGSTSSLLMIDVPRPAASRASTAVAPTAKAPGTITVQPPAAAAPTPAPSPAPAPAPAPSPAPSPAPGPAPAAASGAPVSGPAFRRVLRLTAPRLSGEDVRAVQNRLIALSRRGRGGSGDGWFGPVTSATVRAFQEANGLPATGVVDRVTWDALFSAGARPYDPNDVDAKIRPASDD